MAALEPYARCDFAEARAGEIEHSCLDVTRARQKLGWRPEVDLATGLQQTTAATRIDRVPVTH